MHGLDIEEVRLAGKQRPEKVIRNEKTIRYALVLDCRCSRHCVPSLYLSCGADVVCFAPRASQPFVCHAQVSNGGTVATARYRHVRRRYIFPPLSIGCKFFLQFKRRQEGYCKMQALLRSVFCVGCRGPHIHHAGGVQ